MHILRVKQRDGTYREVPALIGPKGEKGDTVTVTSIEAIGGDDTRKTYAMNFSDGSVQYFDTERGEKGEKGEQGIQGEKGEKGATGEKGEKGATGETGSNGVSCTHVWNGTTLSVTSASGTSSANLKGEKGDTGEKGDKGDKGDPPALNTENWTFTLADGTKVTKAVYVG